MTQTRLLQIPHDLRIQQIAEKLMKKHNLGKFVVTAIEQNATIYRSTLIESKLYTDQQIELMVNKKMDDALDHIIATLPQTLVTAFQQGQAQKSQEQKETRSLPRLT